MINKNKHTLKKAALLLISSCIIYFVLELGLRDFKLISLFRFISNHKKITLVSIVTIFLLLMFFSLIFNNLWVSSILSIYISLIVSVATHLKIEVRMEPVFPSDILFVTSFKDLIGMVHINYIFIFVLISLTVFSLVFVLSRTAPVKLFEDRKKSLVSFFSLLLIILVALTSIRKVHSEDNLYKKIMKSSGFNEVLWNPLRTYQENSFVLGFVNNFSGTAMVKPENYSKDLVFETLQKYQASADEINTTRYSNSFDDISLVYILSESLADPRNLNGVELNENPIPYIQDKSDKYVSGKLIVPAYGGGTSNTEYEILTSFNVQDLEQNMSMPFQHFLSNHNSFPSIVSDFKKIEDNTAVSIHSFHSKLYKRRAVYKTLGFDRSIFEDEMKHRETVQDGKFISDRSSYMEVLDFLKSKNNKFIHLVTMQNHTPYEDVYDKYDFVPTIKNSKEETLKQIQYYTQGIHITNHETRKLISEIKDMDKKVVVVFYGDHHPGLYNDVQELNNKFEYGMTDFFIFSNFNDSKVLIDKPISTTMISNYVYDVSGVKINSIQQLISELHSDIISYKGDDYLLKDGSIVSSSELSAKQKELLSDYRLIQYDYIEGRRYSDEYLSQGG